MRRRGACGPLFLALLFAVVACLVFASLAAVLVRQGEVPAFAPRLTDFQPHPGFEFRPTTPITLAFDQPMDPDSVEAAFSLQPVVAGAFEWTPDHTQVTFAPAGEGYLPGTTFTARLAAGAEAAMFWRTTARSVEWRFSLPPLLRSSVPLPGATDVGAHPRLEAESNYVLDCRRTLLTFTIDSSIPGQLECEGQKVVFSPTLSLEPGKAYAASLAHIFLEGDSTPRPGVQWQLQTAAPLNVEDVDPVSQALIDDFWSAVHIVFSRPVVADSVLPRFALLAEDGERLSGQVRWEAGGATLVFQPDGPLRPETRYHLHLEAGVRDELGFALVQPLDVEFTTLGLLGLPEPIPGTEGVALDTRLRIPFTRPMDRASVEAGLAFTPTLEGAATWEADTLVFAPRGGLAAETSYTVRLSPAIRDATGVPLSQRREWPFSTEPFLLESRVPSGEAVHQLQQAVELSFALPMDPDSVAAALVISPTTPGQLIWSEDRRQASFQPQPGWRSGVDYRVTLAATAGTATGLQSLGQDVIWEFATAAVQVGFGEGPHVQIVDASGARAFQFVLRGADVADFSLYPLTRTQFLNLYQAPVPILDPTKPVISATMPLIATAAWRERLTPLGEGTSSEDWSPAEGYLPADLPPGLYLLSGGSEPLGGLAEANSLLLVVLTRQALVLKRALTGSGPQGLEQIVAWDTELGTGAPVVSATVQLYDRAGNVLAQGLTDASGLLTLEMPGDLGPTLALGELGEDVTVCGLDGEWGEGEAPEGGAPPASGEAYVFYLYTDRPIYAPGQQIRFKAWIRAADGVSYTLPGPDLPISVRLRDARDNLAAVQVLTPTVFGTISGAFQLAEETMLGTWHLETEVAGSVARLPFQVEAAQRQQYGVSVRTSQKDYVPTETISVTVESSYHWGQPAAGAKVLLQVYPMHAAATPEEVGLEFGPSLLSEEGWTDDQGRWTAALPADRLLGDAGPDDPLRLALEATVEDGSGLEVSSYELVRVHPTDRRLVLFLARRGYGPEEEISFSARLQDRDGQRVPGAELVARVLGWDDAEVAVGATTTDGAGMGHFSVRLAEQGSYRLVVAGNDGAGRSIAVEGQLWVYDPAGQAPTYGGRWGPDAALTVSADRLSYGSGDEARLLVHAEATGPALLTLERDGTRSARVLSLISGTNLITVPVQVDHAPNVHVTVNQFGPLDPEVWGNQRSAPEAELRTASIELLVPMASRRLTLTLETDRQLYAPGDEAELRFRVIDAEGQPVTAEISLSVVDEASFSLAEELFQDPFAAFYAPRPDLVSTFDSLRPTRWLFPTGGTAPGQMVLTQGPRRDFLDTAYWAPALVTDENGEALAHLQLPDSLTEWRVMARAITTDTLVGEATALLARRQELVLRPLLPSFVVAGEPLTLTAQIQSSLSEPVSATVSLSLEGMSLAAAAGDGVQVLHVPAGGSVLAQWPVLVEKPASPPAQGVGQARVSLSVVATQRGTRLKGQDDVEVKLPVFLPTVTQVETSAGELTAARASETLTLTAPVDALPGLSQLQIDLAPSLVPGLLDALEYLADSPQASVEQTTSQLLSSAVLSRTLRELDLAAEQGVADLPAVIALDLQELYGYQHDDGGWGWWYDDDTSVDQTAHVLLGLSLTERAGFDVDDGVLQRGVALLHRELPGADAPMQAFGAYVLSSLGPPLTRTLSLTEALSLDSFSQAALALALDAAGDEDAVAALLDVLRESALHDGEMTHWPGQGGDGGRSMGSAVRATAMVAEALIQLDPALSAAIPLTGSESVPQMRILLPRAVRWLQQQRQGPGWADSQQTSYALLALSDYVRASWPPAAGASYQIYVGDLLWSEGDLAPQGAGHSLVLTYGQAISPALLLPGENLVRLVLGAGEAVPAGSRLYYHANWQIQRAFPDGGIGALAPHERSIALAREYRLPASPEAATSLRRGDLVEVYLTLDVPTESWYVVVSDPLPAGLEALNQALGIPSHVVADGEPASSWQELGYNRKEVHPDRVTFYITRLEPGRHVLRYLARATAAGDFVARPAEAYLMYEPEAWSRSASSRCQIR